MKKQATKNLALALAVFFLTAFSLFAGQITASLEPEEASLGDSITLTLDISGELESDITIPAIPGVSISGSGKSQQLQIINGRVERHVSLHYYLEVSKPGRYQIPAITAKVDGSVVHSQPLQLNVAKASDHVIDEAEAEDSNAAQDGSRDSAKQLPSAFVERKLSQRSPYVGEPVLSATKLYFRVQVTGEERRPGKTSDVRSSEAGKETSQEQFAGLAYQVLTYYDVLIPQKAGKLSLPADQVHIQFISRGQNRRTGDPFSDFFRHSFAQTQEKVLASQEESLQVRPIPSENRPADFQGVVGNFELSSSLSNRSLKQGETTTLTLTLSGTGSLDTMGAFPLSLDSGIKIYPDKPSNEETISKSRGLHSKRTFKFALVPTLAGKLPLGKVQLSVFNPGKEAFETLSVDLGDLEVEAVVEDKKIVTAQSQQFSSWDDGQKSQVKALAQDLVDLHRNFAASTQQDLNRRHVLLAGLAVFSSLSVYALSVLSQRLRRRRESLSPEQKRWQAAKKFKLAQTQWEKHWARDRTSPAALAAYYQLFRDYLGAKLGCNGQTLTSKEMVALLTRVGVPARLAQKIEALAQQMDSWAYSPKAAQPEAALGLRQTMDALIAEMESQC